MTPIQASILSNCGIESNRIELFSPESECSSWYTKFSKGNPFSGGVKYTGVGTLAIFVRFSKDIAVYLGNGTR